MSYIKLSQMARAISAVASSSPLDQVQLAFSLENLTQSIIENHLQNDWVKCHHNSSESCCESGRTEHCCLGRHSSWQNKLRGRPKIPRSSQPGCHPGSPILLPARGSRAGIALGPPGFIPPAKRSINFLGLSGLFGMPTPPTASSSNSPERSKKSGIVVWKKSGWYWWYGSQMPRAVAGQGKLHWRWREMMRNVQVQPEALKR